MTNAILERQLDIAALDQAVSVTDETLTVNASLLPDAPFAGLVNDFHAGQTVIVSHATKTATSDTVTVSGTASLLGVTDVATTATFAITGSGVAATIRFSLIGDVPGAHPWSFSTSFPDLPKIPTAYPGPATQSALDGLLLTNAAFVYTNIVGVDAETGAPLQPGMNFVAHIAPAGVIGLFGALLAPGKIFVVYGTIVMPGTLPTQPLGVNSLPWSGTVRAPGILLQVALGIETDLGKLHLDSTALSIYTPASQEWLVKNRSWAPVQAVTTRLTLPTTAGANDPAIKVALAAILTPGLDCVTLSGAFTGFSIGNLARLTDLANGHDLLDALPAEVRNNLGAVTLNQINIAINTAINANSIREVYIVVGLAETWTPVAGLSVGDLQAGFYVDQPFTANRSLTVQLDGTLTVAGAAFDIRTRMPGFNIRALLERDATLSLKELFSTYLPGLPAPPDLIVNEMQVIVAPGQDYSFWSRMADDPGWALDLGPTPMVISNVELSVEKPVSGDVSGGFSGTLDFDDTLTLDVTYQIPGDFSIRAELPTVTLKKLITRLADTTGLNLPNDFDITFSNTYVLIERAGAGLQFGAATQIADFGTLAFAARRDSKWGFALGIDLDTDLKSAAARLPLLQPVTAFQDFMGLERLMLVLSSLQTPGFEFPDLSKFNAPFDITNQRLKLPAQSSGLVQGLNIYAKVNAAKNEGLKALAKWLGIDMSGTVSVTVAVSLPSPTTNSKVFLPVDTTIQKGTSLVGELGGLLRGPDVGAYLSGKVDTSIEDQNLSFLVSAMVLTNGVLVQGSAIGTLTFGPLQLSNLALMVGMDWEGVPSLGVAATVDVENLEGSVAVFFDSVDPVKSLLAGSISDLSIASVARALAGGATLPAELADILDKVGLKSIKAFNIPANAVHDALTGRNLTTLSSCFQQYGQMSIPGDTKGLLLVANTDGRTWHLTDLKTCTHYTMTLQRDLVQVDMQPQLYIAPSDTWLGDMHFPQGLHVIGEIDYLILQAQIKIEVDISRGVAADATLKPITLINGDFFALTGTGGEGPKLSLSTYDQPANPDPKLRGPHLIVASTLRFLGLDISSVYLSVCSSGLEFHVDQQVGPVLHLQLDGRVIGLTDMSAGGKVDLGIRKSLNLGPLGSLNLDVMVTGALTAGVSDNNGSALLTAGFEFQGHTFNLPKFNLPFDGLGRLASLVGDAVEAAIRDYLNVAGQWLDWAKRNVIQGIEGADQIAKVLASVFNEDANAVARALQSVGYSISDIGGAIESVFSLNGPQLVHVLSSIGGSIGEIANTLSRLFGPDSTAIAQALLTGGFPLPAVIGVVHSLVNDPTQVVKILAALGQDPASIASSLVSVWGMGPQIVLKALETAGYGPDTLARVASSVFNLGAEQVASLLNQMGLPGDQIAGVLKNVYGWTADQVTGFLKDTLGYGSDAVKAVLTGVGYTADQVGKALSSAFSTVVEKLNPAHW